MNKFFDLYRQSPPRPGEGLDPSRVDRRFAELVKGSPLQLWAPGDPVAPRGPRLLIGVAPWSGYDMRLLDAIATAVAPGAPAPRIDVFNTNDCETHDAFAAYIPNLGPVFQTPVVGVWRDGQLEAAKQGYEARDLVARMFGTTSDEVVAFVLDRLKLRTPT